MSRASYIDTSHIRLGQSNKADIRQYVKTVKPITPSFSSPSRPSFLPKPEGRPLLRPRFGA